MVESNATWASPDFLYILDECGHHLVLKATKLASSKIYEGVFTAKEMDSLYRIYCKECCYEPMRNPKGKGFELAGDAGEARVYVARDSLGHTHAIKIAKEAVYDESLSSEHSLFQEAKYLRQAKRLGGFFPEINDIDIIYPLTNEDPRRAPYIDMEFLAEGRLSEKPDLTPFQIILYGIDVCRSLKAVHSLNIGHGDLKPDNIMLHKTALGLHAYLLDITPLERRRFFTLPYTAPEVVQSAQKDIPGTEASINHCTADAFAFGATFYEFLTRKIPFGIPAERKDSKERRNQKMTAHIENVRQRVRKPLTEFPGLETYDELEVMLNACLEFEPGYRPSIDEIGNELEGLLQN